MYFFVLVKINVVTPFKNAKRSKILNVFCPAIFLHFRMVCSGTQIGDFRPMG